MVRMSPRLAKDVDDNEENPRFMEAHTPQVAKHVPTGGLERHRPCHLADGQPSRNSNGTKASSGLHMQTGHLPSTLAAAP